MPEEPKTPPKEFLIVALPDRAEAGANLRLLGTAGSQAEAEKLVGHLDTGTLGRVAVLERKGLFLRQPAVETVEVFEPIAKK